MSEISWRIILPPLAGALLLIFLPLLLLQENAYIQYEDNLDGELVCLVLLKANNMLFSIDQDAMVPNIMNGLSRNYFHSEFSFIRVLFYMFPPFWAYVLNAFIIRLLAFAGMYLLLRDFIILHKKTAAFVAAIFSIIPLYTMYGLSTAGVPLMLWVFLRILDHRERWYDYLFIILFPFYSHIAIIGPFLVVLLASVAGYRMFIQKGKVPMKYYISIFLLLAFFIAANYSLILSYISPGGVIPHRKEWDPQPYGMQGALKQFIKLVLFGHIHATSFLTLPIYLTGVIALWNNRNNRYRRMVLMLPFVVIISICAFVALYPILRHALHDELHILTTFQLTRFIALLPLMLFLIAGLACRYSAMPARLFYALLLVQGIIILYSAKEVRKNYAHIASKGINAFNDESFDAYYSTDLYGQVKTFIGRDVSSYRIASVGLEPSVALYNGFYTLDGYMSIYPLEYKHSFRKIIELELNKTDSLRRSFDTWGNKCYIFAAELQYCCKWNCGKTLPCKIDNLEISATAFREMGGEYLFSGVPVNNFRWPGFTYLKTFESPHSRYRVYLYKVNGGD